MSPSSTECPHPHGQIIRGHDALTDMAWCDVCGAITWASDHPPLEKPEGMDRKDWVRNRLIAWGCGAETEGQQHCSVWCGNPKYCVASLRATQP